MSLSALALELELTEEELDSIPLELDDLQENTGNSGEMIYGYYFYVPESTPSDILKKKKWAVAECVYISINVFDKPEDY